MKFKWFILLACGLAATGSSAQEIRTWTSASGKTIEASFVEQKFDQVILQTSEGEKLKIRLNQLSSADQIHVGGLSRPVGAPALGPTAVSSEVEVPPELADLFGKRLVNAKGRKSSTAELAGKKIGIYFSASWCPPCRAFTPKLVDAYNQLRTEGKPFEVVLVSHDRDESSMKAYMKSHEMPWLAVPFGDKHMDALKKKFGVAGIPTLVVVDATGKTLSAKARGEVTADGAKAFDKW